MNLILNQVLRLVRSKWKVILVVVASIVVALLLRNVLVGVVGVVGALVQGVFGGEPVDSPRRTSSGNLPNNPTNPSSSPNTSPNQPGSPSGGPRRRRR